MVTLPKMGDMIIYNHPRGADDSKQDVIQSPAVVQRVNLDGSLELFVMRVDGSDKSIHHNVKHGEGFNNRWELPVVITR